MTTPGRELLAGLFTLQADGRHPYILAYPGGEYAVSWREYGYDRRLPLRAPGTRLTGRLLVQEARSSLVEFERWLADAVPKLPDDFCRQTLVDMGWPAEGVLGFEI